MDLLLETLEHAALITALVAVMMIVVEYLNVLSNGRWQSWMRGGVWRQLVIAALLGASPGCLGAYVVVALYAHRMACLGAVMAAMVATTGDESFIMMSLFPGRAVVLTAALALLGVLVGWVTEVARPRAGAPSNGACEGIEVHVEDRCQVLPGRAWSSQLRHLHPIRGILATAIAIYLVAVVSGRVEPELGVPMHATFALVSAFGLFVVLSVPDHFLQDHLWRHVLRRHVPRVFLWTAAALGAVAVIGLFVDIESVASRASWILVVTGALLGLIPQSGPHIPIVMLFAQGHLPLSVLVANSISQDGHGMLPMLAHSRRDFFLIKVSKALLGLAVGAAMMAAGW